jgi:hypothetical protein
MLAASDARIASGRLSRDDLLARFAPLAQGVAAPHPRERVTLLLATDLLSEGVNLQDAAVVVHLDLPWNPARLAQRLGRIRRPGGACEVTSYLMSPPARSALLLRAEARLREKLAQAEQTIGRGLDVLPALSADVGRAHVASSAIPVGGSASALAVAELRGEIHRMLTRWRCSAPNGATLELQPSGQRVGDEELIIAAAQSSAHGWIAVLDDGRLIASLGGPDGTTALSDDLTDDLVPILQTLRNAEGVARPAHDVESLAARRAIEHWIMHDWARRSCGLTAIGSPLRRLMLHRLESALRSVPRHRRHSALSRAASLRAALEGRLTLGVERALAELPEDPDGTRWMERAGALLSTPADPGSPPAATAGTPRPRAIILLGPD